MRASTFTAIALRHWLRSRRRSAGLCFLLGAILAALVWTHSGAEAMAMPMPDDRGEAAMAMCVAILDATLLVSTGAGLRSFKRRRFESTPPLDFPMGPFRRARPPLAGPPPRAGPSRLQVFLL